MLWSSQACMLHECMWRTNVVSVEQPFARLDVWRGSSRCATIRPIASVYAHRRPPTHYRTHRDREPETGRPRRTDGEDDTGLHPSYKQQPSSRPPRTNVHNERAVHAGKTSSATMNGESSTSRRLAHTLRLQHTASHPLHASHRFDGMRDLVCSSLLSHCLLPIAPRLANALPPPLLVSTPKHQPVASTRPMLES